MASSTGVSTVLWGELGLMGASSVVVLARHLVTVVRLSPKRWAKLLVFSFDAWSSARTRGVVRAEP